MIKYMILLVLILTMPCFAQLPGDLNCNGYAYEIADVVIGLRILIEGCSWNVQDCTLQNGDIDADGQGLTMTDWLELFSISRGDSIFPNYQRHPEADTFSIASASVLPGQHISLPVFLNTVDTIMGLQFYLVPDTDFVTIDSFIVDQNFQLQQSICSDNIYVSTPDTEIVSPSVGFVLPGYYHLGNLMITINPNIDHPVTTHISFSDDPHRAAYSGLANIAFFRPVMANSEIQILPLGINAGNSANLPEHLSVVAYPNPFNASTMITINSSSSGRLSICDLLGQVIRNYDISRGENNIAWNATTSEGQAITTGIYFAGVINADSKAFEKLIYLK